MNWETLNLAPLPDIVITEHGSNIPAAIAREVSNIWAAAKAERPALYDGRVFSVTLLEPDRIEGYWCPYSRVLAQMRKPGLFADLKLRPLAVTTLLQCPQGAIIGLRAPGMVYLPDTWQGVPAGSIESRDGSSSIDLHAQLLDECWEELGLTAQDVRIGASRIACEHADSHIIDLAFEATTDLDFPDVEASWQAHGNREYAALRLVTADSAEAAMAEPAVLPTMRAMLQRAFPTGSSFQ